MRKLERDIGDIGRAYVFRVSAVKCRVYNTLGLSSFGGAVK